MGFRLLKFFPAEAQGGTRFLGALQDVVPDVGFCATGGIYATNAAAYLALRNVRAVGGSWMIARAADGRVDVAATRSGLAAALQGVTGLPTPRT